ncbi:hypothetical protein Tco_0186342 [Tanacetum coccineum]
MKEARYIGQRVFLIECRDGDTLIVSLTYRIRGIDIRFGREDFGLVTGLRFGTQFVSSFEHGGMDFRRRVFRSESDGESIIVGHLYEKIMSSYVIPSGILTHDHIEIRMPWWVHIKAYFNGSAPPIVIPSSVNQFSHGARHEYVFVAKFSKHMVAQELENRKLETAPSYTLDVDGDDVTYIGQDFTREFPTMYNVYPRKTSFWQELLPHLYKRGNDQGKNPANECMDGLVIKQRKHGDKWTVAKDDTTSNFLSNKGEEIPILTVDRCHTPLKQKHEIECVQLYRSVLSDFFIGGPKLRRRGDQRYNGIMFTHDPKSAKVSKGFESPNLQGRVNSPGSSILADTSPWTNADPFLPSSKLFTYLSSILLIDWSCG